MELKQGRDFVLLVLGQGFMEPRLAPESVAKDNLELLTLESRDYNVATAHSLRATGDWPQDFAHVWRVNHQPSCTPTLHIKGENRPILSSSYCRWSTLQI